MKKLGYGLVLAACLALVAPGALAGTVQFKSDAISGYGVVSGGLWNGEVRAYASGIPGVPNGPWITFCAEKLEDINFATYNAAVNTVVIKGGQPVSEPLYGGTAWLYDQFVTGSISITSNADAQKFQLAIWAMQNDITAPAPTTNLYYDAAMSSSWQSSGYIGDVRVLNLGPAPVYPNQDVLVKIIPEPLTLLAVFGGVCGLGGYIRRRL